MPSRGAEPRRCADRMLGRLETYGCRRVFVESVVRLDRALGLT